LVDFDYQFWGLLLRPFIALAFLAAVCIPVRLLMRRFPEGKLKRILLRKIS